MILDESKLVPIPNAPNRSSVGSDKWRCRSWEYLGKIYFYTCGRDYSSGTYWFNNYLDIYNPENGEWENYPLARTKRSPHILAEYMIEYQNFFIYLSGISLNSNTRTITISIKTFYKNTLSTQDDTIIINNVRDDITAVGTTYNYWFSENYDTVVLGCNVSKDGVTEFHHIKFNKIEENYIITNDSSSYLFSWVYGVDDNLLYGTTDVKIVDWNTFNIITSTTLPTSYAIRASLKLMKRGDLIYLSPYKGGIIKYDTVKNIWDLSYNTTMKDVGGTAILGRYLYLNYGFGNFYSYDLGVLPSLYFSIYNNDGTTKILQTDKFVPTENLKLNLDDKTALITLSDDSRFQWEISGDPKRFAGIAFSENAIAPNILADGNEYAFALDGEVNIYEVYKTAPVDPTTFEATFYNSDGEDILLDKTPLLKNAVTVLGTLRKGSSIITPDMIFAFNSVPTYNYCYIPLFHRYYFITNIESTLNGLWHISMRVDPLMSYKSEILSQTALISRNQYSYNPLIRDDRLPATSEIVRSKQTFKKGDTFNFMNTWDNNSYQYVITCISNYNYESVGNYATKTFKSNTKYILNRNQLNSLINEMNTADFLNAVKNLFANEPMQAIQSIRAYPFTLPTTGRALEDIYLGTYHTSVQGYRFEDADHLGLNYLGYFNCTQFNTWEAYEYEMQMYVPFFGFIPISPEYAMQNYVGLYMNVDYDSGSATLGLFATKEVSSTTNTPDFEERDYFKVASAVIGIDIPLSQINQSEIFRNTVQSAISLAGGVALSNVPSILGGTSNLILGNKVSYSNGNYTFGAFGGFHFGMNPYLDIYYRVYETRTDTYKSLYGLPYMKTELLSNLTGYTEIQDMHLENFGTATNEEIRMIENILKTGVIL